MTRRILWVLVIELLGLLSSSYQADGQGAPPLPSGTPAPPDGWERALPLAEERLTKADIPSDLPPDLKKELASTFDADPKGRAKAAEAIGKRGVHAAAAVPFLIRLLRDDAEVGEMPHTVSFSAWTALAAIGRPAVEACLSALKRSSGEPRESLILVLGSTRDPRLSTLSLRCLRIRVRRSAAKRCGR